MLLDRQALLTSIFGPGLKKGDAEYAVLANLVIRNEIPYVMDGRFKKFREEDLEEIKTRILGLVRPTHKAVFNLAKEMNVSSTTMQSWCDRGLLPYFDRGKGFPLENIEEVKATVVSLKEEKENILGKHKNEAHMYPCKSCGTLFKVKPSHYIGNQKITCSDACKTQYIKTQKVFIGAASNAYIEIPDELRQILHGELLGDGCLYIQKKNTGMNALFQYGTANVEYSNYLKKQFAILKPAHTYCYGMESLNGEDINIRFQWCTKSNPSLTEEYVKWYPVDHKKIVPEDLKLTPLVVRHWYIGDGYLSNSGKRGEQQVIGLCTQGFDLESIERLIFKLEEIGILALKRENGFNISGEMKYSIQIKSSHLSRFLKYIGECPVESYEYKWNLDPTYKDYEVYIYSTGDIGKKFSVTAQLVRNWAQKSWFRDAKIDCKYMWSRLRFSEEGYQTLKRTLEKVWGQNISYLLKLRSIESLAEHCGVAHSVLQSWFEAGLICKFDKKIDMIIEEDAEKAIAEILKIKGENLKYNPEELKMFQCKKCGTMFATRPESYANGFNVTCSGDCQEFLRRMTKVLDKRGSQKIHEVPKIINQVVLNDISEVIDGELLGRANLQKSKNGTAVFFSTKEKEHVEIVKMFLEDLEPTETRNFKGHTGSNTYCWETKALPILNQVYSKWYVDDNKILPIDLKLTSTVARHWYMSSGFLSTVAETSQQVLGLRTNCFSEHELNFLIKKFKEININISKQFSKKGIDGVKKYILVVSALHMHKFLRYMGPCTINCYKHKWDLNEKYKWIDQFPYATKDLMVLLGKTKAQMYYLFNKGSIEANDIQHKKYVSKEGIVHFKFSEEGVRELAVLYGIKDIDARLAKYKEEQE